jgi:hypothetical protein
MVLCGDFCNISRAPSADKFSIKPSPGVQGFPAMAMLPLLKIRLSMRNISLLMYLPVGRLNSGMYSVTTPSVVLMVSAGLPITSDL